MHIKERYTPVPMAANATYITTSDQIGGFLCKTAGTISVVAKGVTLVDAVAVAAGVYYPLPFYVGDTGATITLGGGAVGTLAV